VAASTHVHDPRRRSTPGNLPVELSSFVGRTREQLEIRRLLAVTHTVTLTGPGGIGKSRLGLRVAHTVGRHFRDGVWWIELGELDSPDRVARALAHALNVYEQPEAAIQEALVAHVRERRLLIVLDDCEGQLDACRELVSAIVSTSDGARVLCTSQQRLGVPGEAVVALSPLAVPSSAEEMPIAALGEIEGLRLLVDRAHAAAPDFALTEGNRGAVSDICRRLDGLPLALELAAARLVSIAPAELLERLDDRFQLLASEGGQQSLRHRTLRATVEWSHELLGEEERILWRRLSVFAGSFGIDAVEAVCSGEGLERGRVLDAIGSLVERSILTMERTGGGGRYRLPETMRLFAAERLREAGEESELRRRHATWYEALVTRDDLPWWTAWEADLVDQLDAEWANLETALDFFAASAPDASTGLRMATDLWPYWVVRGSYRMGRRRIEAFLALAQQPGSARALAFFASGFLAQASNDHEAAVADFDEAYRLSAETGGDRERAYALVGLGLVRLRRGDLGGATDAFVASREAMQTVDGDPVGRSIGLYYLATALAGQGQLREARGLAEEALAGMGASSDSLGHGVVHALVGIFDWLLGDLDSAEARLKEAVRVQDRLGHRWGLATSLDGLAWVAASTRRLDRAALLLGAVASLWRELGVVPVPYWQHHHEACEADVRAGLGDTRFERSRDQGLALRREQVTALALDDAAPPAERAGGTTGEDAFELTARELEVARLVAHGLSNPAIAGALFVSRATVKTHVSHILRKLALDSRVQLASWVAAHDPGAAMSDRE
jgi:non-specific serine/threonine protein kinase